jgi:hypothetical protein
MPPGKLPVASGQVRKLMLLVLAPLALAPPAHAVNPPKLWPPPEGNGYEFVHYGEEHLDDLDGPRIFPKVIADTIRFRPDVVVASADKSSNGTQENLEKWKEHMAAYDRAGIPYFAGVGNHDREALPGFPHGVSPFSPLGPYLTVFADRPYPFGDAAPIEHPSFAPKERPAGDPDGASSHYAFDFGNVRWLVLDNSCFSFTTCDDSQNPPFDGSAGNDDTYGFLAAQAAEATRQGKLVFVSMHMPTQDPRPEHTQPTPSAHTMGEGTAPDNAMLEQAAAENGIDGVFAGHIKGQWIYEAGGVPYYIDGGAGGEVYVGDDEEVGLDYGYWHGWRLLRVIGNRVVTDAVPVFVPGGIKVTGPASASLGSKATFKAIGKQPTQDGPRVDSLQLREPDPERPNAANLPEPARIWTSGEPLVLAPIASKDDDPRRDRRSQTQGGQFQARCPGRTKVTITSGVERRSHAVTIKSRRGQIVRRIARRATVVRTGTRTKVVRVTLRQPALVDVRVLRRGRVVKSLKRACSERGLSAAWDGRNQRRRRARPGRYTVQTLVTSDRRPVRRRFSVRLTR